MFALEPPGIGFDVVGVLSIIALFLAILSVIVLIFAVACETMPATVASYASNLTLSSAIHAVPGVLVPVVPAAPPYCVF